MAFLPKWLDSSSNLPCRSTKTTSKLARFQGRPWRTGSDTSLALRHRPASGSHRRSPSGNGVKVGSNWLNLTDLWKDTKRLVIFGWWEAAIPSIHSWLLQWNVQRTMKQWCPNYYKLGHTPSYKLTLEHHCAWIEHVLISHPRNCLSQEDSNPDSSRSFYMRLARHFIHISRRSLGGCLL